jgi:hypothetical protein
MSAVAPNESSPFDDLGAQYNRSDHVDDAARYQLPVVESAMTRMKAITAALFLALGTAAAAAEPPTASISNGTVHATLQLPDVNDGYYRGARFDWSGSIASLEAAGHSYFGQWFANWGPHVHDSITGPVEDYAPLNHTEAKPGETFVKIGIGVLRKIDDQPYRFTAPYLPRTLSPGE